MQVHKYQTKTIVSHVPHNRTSLQILEKKVSILQPEQVFFTQNLASFPKH